jgi:outer membrane murein-binding lipoprotein Lpp
MSEKKERKTAGKTTFIVFGIVCIVLTAGLIATITVYSSIIRDKDSSISSLNSQVSSLNSKVTNLQDQVRLLQEQVDGLLNATATSVSVDEISLHPSTWLNRTVAVEGNLTGPYNYAGLLVYAWNYLLSSNGTSVGVFSLDGPSGPVLFQPVKALVLGVVIESRDHTLTVNGDIPVGPVQYIIEAKKVYLLQ